MLKLFCLDIQTSLRQSILSALTSCGTGARTSLSLRESWLIVGNADTGICQQGRVYLHQRCGPIPISGRFLDFLKNAMHKCTQCKHWYGSVCSRMSGNPVQSESV